MRLGKSPQHAKSLWSSNPIPGGCVLYLPLWNPGLSGSVFNSVDPFGRICTVTDALWTPQGRTFDGASDIKHTADDWRSGDSAGSILVWFKTSTSANMELFTTSLSTSTLYYMEFRIESTGKLQILQRNNDTVTELTGDSVNNDDIWHLGAVVSSGTTYSLSIDGEAEGLTGTNNGDWFADTLNRDNFAIGALFYNSIRINYLTGKIGEVWVYNRVLTLVDLLHIYNATKWRYV